MQGYDMATKMPSIVSTRSMGLTKKSGSMNHSQTTRSVPLAGSRSYSQRSPFNRAMSFGIEGPRGVNPQKYVDIEFDDKNGNNNPVDIEKGFNGGFSKPSLRATTTFLSFGGSVQVDDDYDTEEPEPTESIEAAVDGCPGSLETDDAFMLNKFQSRVLTELMKPSVIKDGSKQPGTFMMQDNWFTVYKFLFMLSLLLNTVGIALALKGRYQYARTHASQFAVGNVLLLVMVRNEATLRIVFWLVVQIFGHRCVPLRVKLTLTALLQSLGGIHSGCGLASVMWLIYGIVLAIRGPLSSSSAIVGVSIAILVLIVMSCVAAFPVLRHNFHNTFEGIHRFSGWTCLVLVWVFVTLSASYDPVSKFYRSDRDALVNDPSLWFLALTTFMILLPWMSVRKVPVDTIIPDGRNNSLILFGGGVEPGLLARISRSPLSDWHAFGIISDARLLHVVLAGAVGDFTQGLVEDPPQYLWVRTLHFAGLPYLTNMYNRVLLVATGSGICVFLSFLLQPTRANVHVIWIAKKIQNSYGDNIYNAVSSIPPTCLTLIDTALTGRPKTGELAVRKAKEFNSEVVIVTSNANGTREVVRSCQEFGIPAFGPIWDS